eukprot:TRINITY_DN12446_c0_g1_i1.p1 TRINITY_DN12446_c0_g1~~TRINITY_DN12446_c0_g1_i1.p1  ORF type:complete len:302 (+),score=43.38 TRINITY_DN12446_c0_g1_i1:89-907(+)
MVVLDDGGSPAALAASSCEDGAAVGECPGRTIVWDWDDTLLCSTALARASARPDELLAIMETDVPELCGVIERLLRLSKALGDTHILTNGGEDWVQQSASKYMPALVPSLRDMQVTSARAKYEKAAPEDPIEWKRLAFQEIILPTSDSPQAKPLDQPVMVVIGDSEVEIKAAKAAVCPEAFHLKTIKLKERPTAKDLLGQLRVLEACLEDLTHSKCTSRDLTLEKRGDPPSCGMSFSVVPVPNSEVVGCGLVVNDLTQRSPQQPMPEILAGA